MCITSYENSLLDRYWWIYMKTNTRIYAYFWWWIRWYKFFFFINIIIIIVSVLIRQSFVARFDQKFDFAWWMMKKFYHTPLWPSRVCQRFWYSSFVTRQKIFFFYGKVAIGVFHVAKNLKFYPERKSEKVVL